jgi:hypothetical protein
MDLKVRTAVVRQMLGRASSGKFDAQRALVEFRDGTSAFAFVKSLDSRSVAVEVLCAVLGRLCGLPIPEPVLALVPHNGSQWGLAFASLAVGADNLEQRFSADSARVIEALLKWSQVHRAACFDEWIANADRHPGNVLRGSDGRYWLIDHNLAIREGLPAGQVSAGNQLFNLLTSRANNEVDRISLRKDAEREATDLLAFDPVPHVSASTDAISGLLADRDNILAFVVARATHLLSLCAQRTPVAQVGMFDGQPV